MEKKVILTVMMHFLFVFMIITIYLEHNRVILKKNFLILSIIKLDLISDILIY